MPTNNALKKIVVMGASAGGFAAFGKVLSALPGSFDAPIVITQHQEPSANDFFSHYLNDTCQLTVKEAVGGEPLLVGHVYVSPPNYHVLVERDATLTLSADEPVNFSRPSIDVLFESAADSFGERVIGILMTGASKDGAAGLKRIKEKKGLTIAQDPDSAESPFMPRSAIELSYPDYIVHLSKLPDILIGLMKNDEDDS